jgi:3-hydroxybutyryl-CoA dehydrogenase
LLDLTGLDVSHPVMEAIHEQYYGDDRYRPSALARTRLAAGLLGRKSGEGFYRYPRAEAVKSQATEGDTTASVWWPNTGRAAVPSAMALRLDAGSGLRRCEQPGSADWLLLSPIGDDLTQTVADLGLDPRRAIAVDGVFFSDEAVTLMTCPATTTTATGHALRTFGDARFRTTVIADSPGFVAQRVVATVVNLACEMAQQGIATPADIDEAVRLGLGYPQGPFAWGDALGAPTVARILEALYRRFGDPRYRIAPWLARRAALGLSLTTPDR